MRRILVDNARRKKRLKRGGDRRRISLDDTALSIEMKVPIDELLDLDEALGRLAGQDETKASLVKLRCFAGLTGEQAAKALGISSSTADEHWAYARAWLRLELAKGTEPDPR
jgi:RNA polymerase sigma factor (TIGR02999 family)